MAIAIIKTAAIFVKDVMSIFFVPPVITFLIGLYFVYWVVIFVYLYSIGDYYT